MPPEQHRHKHVHALLAPTRDMLAPTPAVTANPHGPSLSS